MVKLTPKLPIKSLLAFVAESKSSQEGWRRQSWEDYEFRDGKHWDQMAFDKLVKKGINPLTINRIFPIVNLIQGHFIRNQQDIIAKGRTYADSELGQTMSEALAYVRDQNKGSEITAAAFNDEIIAGFGCIEVSKNPDPREEPVKWTRNPWYTITWDPYASPWFEKDSCRYVYKDPWKNLDDLIMLFPEKKRDLEDQFSRLTSTYYTPEIYDAADVIEDYHKYLSSNHWVNHDRRRVKPVEMWYTSITEGWFARMPDSRIIDLDTLESPSDQMQVIRYADELIKANVKKMRVATFISDLLLQDVPTPYKHDSYPFVPFVGYLDRFDCPFGIPRQIKEQSMEVNKRRSMALSLISNRRVTIEEDAAKDINKLYDEANRSDGFLVVKKGKLEAVKIQEMQALAAPQIDLMNQSEREIQEIAGANDDALSRDTRLQSGVALDKRQELSATVTASLVENAKYSQRRLGELTMAMVQSEWTGHKVLRVTDRMSGAEKFVAINERIYDQESGAITVRNDISEARFDIVVANAPITDTMREKNMELLFGAINKAPPEAVAPLLNMAFEISDIPNKTALLKQVRASMGMDAIDETLPQAEQDMIAVQNKMAIEQAKAADQELTKREREAKIEMEIAKAVKMKADAAATVRESERADWQAGAQLGQEILKAQTGSVQ